MPLFDTKTLDNDANGTALLASVLFATPQARADALSRGRERLERARPSGAPMAVRPSSGIASCRPDVSVA